MTERIIRIKEVMSMTGLSRSRLYQYIQEERFPASVSLGGNSVGWVESEVQRWVASVIENRDRNVLYGH